MPFTPFHLGPGLFVGLLLLSFIDLPTFLVASVIVDVEPLLILVFRLPYPLHGFFHSFLGGTLLAVPLALVMYRIRGKFSSLMSFFKLEQKTSFKRILVAALAGVYLHILLDSLIYSDIQPFYPSEANPLLNNAVFDDPYLFCVWCFVGAAIIYMIRLALIWKKTR
jgi:membrane-bound metal-dependent hydrolase YbcI (DUF457 family)